MSTGPSDGFTFFLGPSSSVSGNGGGQFDWGRLDANSNPTPQTYGSIGVEYDTYVNSNFFDPNANHVGINVNASVKSVVTAVPPFTLASGVPLWSWVDYNGSTGGAGVAGMVRVYVNNNSSKPASPTLQYSMQLGQILVASQMNLYLGFGAGSGKRHLNPFESIQCCAG